MAINDETLRLAKAMRITIDQEVDAAVRVVVRAWARAWDEIRGTWAEAMMDIAAASTDGQWPSPWLIARSERAQAALLAATDEILALAELTGVTVTDAVGRVVTLTPEWQAQIIASQLPPASGDRLDLVARFTRIDPLAVSAITNRTAQDITAATYRLAAGAQEAMRRTLVRGIVVGDNPRRAAREMLRRAEGAFNGGLTRALVIARTEMLDAHRLAAAGTQIANEDVLEAWIWQAQLDTRTCPSCWGMHGTRHNLEEMGPYDHQQGRCARLPVTKTWRELGFDIDEPASVLPDAETVFGALSPAEQLAVMGPARLQALNDGVVSLADMSQRRTTPGWRDSWAPTPVSDLLRRAVA